MNKLEKVLAEYHRDWQLAIGNWGQRQRPNGKTKTAHQHQIVRWVRDFLRFAKDKTGHKFETLYSPRKNAKNTKNTKRRQPRPVCFEIKTFVKRMNLCDLLCSFVVT